MPITINAPNGDLVDFPDGTSNAVIEAAMAKNYPSPIKQPEEKPANYGRLLAQGLGGVLGGVAAFPASIVAGAPTMGLGAIATEAAGIGLGSGIAGQGYDYLSSFFDKEKPKPFKETAVNAIKEVGETAAFGPIGRTAGVALGAGLIGAKNAVKFVADKFSLEKAKRLAEALKNQTITTGEQTVAAAGKRRTGAEQSLAEANAGIENLPVNAPKPEPTRVGQATEQTSTIGVPVQEAIIGTREAAAKKLIETDRSLRNIQNEIVKRNENNGIEMVNQPSYKLFEKRANNILNWLTQRKSKPDKSVISTYEYLIKNLQPRTVDLTAKEAEEAIRNGIKIRKIEQVQNPTVKDLVFKNGKPTLPEPKYVRDVKPTFENIDDARKWVGEVFRGQHEKEGYAAINVQEKQKLYSWFNQMQEEFAGQAHPRLQKNYAELKAAKDSLEGGIGSKILSEDPAVALEKVLSNTGEQTYNSLVKAVGSERIANKAVADTIASKMTGKNYDETVKIYNKFKQMLFDPRLSDLKMRVDQHLVNVADNAGAAIKTQAKKLDFGQTIAKSTKQIELETQKELLNKNRISGIIAETDPKTAIKNSMSYLKTLADNGEISNEQYVNFLNQANQIDFAKPEAARRALKNIAIAVAGAAGAGAIGTSILRNNTNSYQ